MICLAVVFGRGEEQKAAGRRRATDLSDSEGAKRGPAVLRCALVTCGYGLGCEMYQGQAEDMRGNVVVGVSVFSIQGLPFPSAPAFAFLHS